MSSMSDIEFRGFGDDERGGLAKNKRSLRIRGYVDQWDIFGGGELEPGRTYETDERVSIAEACQTAYEHGAGVRGSMFRPTRRTIVALTAVTALAVLGLLAISGAGAAAQPATDTVTVGPNSTVSVSYELSASGDTTNVTVRAPSGWERTDVAFFERGDGRYSGTTASPTGNQSWAVSTERNATLEVRLRYHIPINASPGEYVVAVSRDTTRVASRGVTVEPLLHIHNRQATPGATIRMPVTAHVTNVSVASTPANWSAEYDAANESITVTVPDSASADGYPIRLVGAGDSSTVGTVIVREPQSPVAALAGPDGRVQFTEVLAGIAAYNEGRTPEGATRAVSFDDVLELIAHYNSGTAV